MIVTILIFIIILGLLVFVHELGHFIVAKRNGVRVDEFGFGFPPRLFGLQRVKTQKIEKIGQEIKESHLAVESFDPDTGQETFSELAATEKQAIEKVTIENNWSFFWGKNQKRQEGEIQRSETVYSINAIPLGGFVKIYGEEGEGSNSSRSFASRKPNEKAKILFAGVMMNFMLTVFLFSLGNFIGLPSAIDENQIDQYHNAKLQITAVSPDAPASSAGLTTGDFVISLRSIDGKIVQPINRPSVFQAFVDSEKGKQITVVVQRGGTNLEFSLVPRANPPAGQGPLGVELATVAKISLPWYRAIWQGFIDTINLIWLLLVVLFGLIKNLIVSGKAGVDIVGPVGIYTLTGQAASMGFIYLLQLTAILSINLAVINAFPFPALDGGRALFLMIEKIKGSPINQKTQNLIHSIGFALLILLIVAITYRDIVRIF
jgi:regulator of sigma E protease